VDPNSRVVGFSVVYRSRQKIAQSTNLVLRVKQMEELVIQMVLDWEYLTARVISYVSFDASHRVGS